MKHLPTIVVAALMLTGAIAAQTPKAGTAPAAKLPNFAGTWIFDADATKANATAVKMNGLPLFTGQFVGEQDARTFTMKIDLATMVVTAVYNLDGSVSKNMSPPLLAGSPPIEVTARARWVGATLVISSTSKSPGADGAPATVKSTRKMWLDAKGRLVVERTGTPRAMVPSSRSVYTKKP